MTDKVFKRNGDKKGYGKLRLKVENKRHAAEDKMITCGVFLPTPIDVTLKLKPSNTAQFLDLDRDGFNEGMNE